MVGLLLTAGLALLAPADTPIVPITEAEVVTAIAGQLGTDICNNTAALGSSLSGLVAGDPETLLTLHTATVTWVIDNFEEDADGTPHTGLGDVGDRALTPEAEKRMKIFLAACFLGIDGR